MTETRGSSPHTNGYLSIREVLDELVGEFDDVTISKIRFLESRGLIQPERSPSGYRKFYPVDVERLRWILRQQRENFLPLKVIKRRLDLQEGRKLELPDSPSLFDDVLTDDAADEALASVVSNIRLATRTVGDNGSTETQSQKAIVNDSVSSLHEPKAEPTASKSHLAAVPSPAKSVQGSEELDARDSGSKHPNHPSQIDGVEQAPPPQPSSETPTNVSVTPDAAREEKSPKQNSGRAPSTKTATPRDNELSDAHLSIDELASAAGTSVVAIAELEEFGFIASQVVAGEPCFDGEALIIAKAITALRSYGLEPRHLKSIRMAAERDASLYAQVVTPLLRQRNPGARSKARSQLDELAEKGVALYEQILRTELRRLGG
jgi:DNA-binding transcriptional MerR regulator